MGTMCKKLDIPLGALEVEAKAAEKGIRLARELGLSPIIIEGDSQVVLNAISSPDPPPSSIKKSLKESKVGSCIEVTGNQMSYIGLAMQQPTY